MSTLGAVRTPGLQAGRGVVGPTGDAIPVAGAWITEAEVDLVSEAAATAWYGGAGRFVADFEAEFARAVGRRFALALPCATAGLHLSLLALGIGPGDEVVVPDATWIASASSITHVGATTVFADVDPATWVLTLESLERAVTGRTRAVIAVGLYGSVPDFDAILHFCAERDIAVIEDAAEAFGSRYRGRPAGSFGATSVFSFHGSKMITTGEGGMVVTDDEALHGRMQFLADHGRLPGDRSFRHGEVAFKYKMTDLQAALGLAQLRRAPEIVALTREIFSWYRDALGASPRLTLNAEPEGVTNSYWMTTAVLDPSLGIAKEELAATLAEDGIATRPFFYPLSSLPAYSWHPQAGRAACDRPVSHRLGTYGINLPSARCLRREHVDRVADAVLRVVGRA